MRSLRTCSISALVVLTIACDGATDPSATPDVTFAVTGELRGPAAEAIVPSKPRVTIRPGQVDIVGQIRTPNPCSTLSSRVSATDGIITLTVTAQRSGADACIQVITIRDYGASVTNVKAGTYTLRVVHVYELPGQPEVVLDQRITVP